MKFLVVVPPPSIYQISFPPQRVTLPAPLPDETLKRIQTWRTLLILWKTYVQSLYDRSSIRPRYLNIPTPSMHSASSSSVRLKDASANRLAVAAFILYHHIYVLLSHLFVCCCFISHTAGMRMPHM